MSATKDPAPRTPVLWTAPPAPPVRQYSFTDWQTNNPTAPPPGDRMDAEYDRANAAISQTITWAETSLNTDGSLRAGTVGESQLVSGLFDDIAQDIIDEVQPLVNQAQGFASAAAASQTAAAGSASAASAANTAAQGSAVTASNAAVLAATANTSAQGYATTAQTAATQAQNADNHAEGAAALADDYADVTQAWAEHMPDTIPPNILAVMAVTGDHWSARWWANQAAQMVTLARAQYLQVLLYRATANQTVFPLTTADLGSRTYAIKSAETLEIYLNGVRLPEDTPNPGNGDWTLNRISSVVTFLTPLLAGSMVQVSVAAAQLVPLTQTNLNLPPAQPDGSPPVGAVKGDLYDNGGFVCVAR